MALCLFGWFVSHDYDSVVGGEGAAFQAFAAALVAGLPFNLIFSIIVDYATPAIHAVPGLNVFHVLLVGVVINWVLIGAAVDWFVNRREKRKARV